MLSRGSVAQPADLLLGGPATPSPTMREDQLRLGLATVTRARTATITTTTTTKTAVTTTRMVATTVVTTTARATAPLELPLGSSRHPGRRLATQDTLAMVAMEARLEWAHLQACLSKAALASQLLRVSMLTASTLSSSNMLEVLLRLLRLLARPLHLLLATTRRLLQAINLPRHRLLATEFNSTDAILTL